MEYLNEDEFFLANTADPDLSGKDGRYAIKVELPTLESFFGCPREEALKKVVGYGLPPEKQKFDYYRDTLKLFVLPPKLGGLISKLTDELTRKNKGKAKEPTIEQIFDAIEENPNEYESEIKWIKIQKKRSHQGFWCFIKSKPTYIDGDHYTYLTNAEIANPYRKDRMPFFRDVDRRTFLFMKWARTTTDSLFKYKVIGRVRGEFKTKYFNTMKALNRYVKQNMVYYQVEEGDFIIDMGKRTCMGTAWATRRGQGKTYIMGHIGTKICLNTPMGKFAIQALTEDTAKDDVYGEKILAPFKSMFFFYKPSNSYTLDDIKMRPAVESSLDKAIQRHGGWIRPRSSKNKAFDGNRVHAYGNDESAKKTSGDIFYEYTDTVKKMLALGGNIIGFAMYFTTFGEMEKGGGKQFMQLCKQSFSHKRNDFGLTGTGLITYFTPAYDGYDDYIDEWGYSIIEDPEYPIKNAMGIIKEEGAKTFLESEREYKRQEEDWIGLNTETRDNPFTLREASKPIIRVDNVDISIATTRLEYLEFDEDAKHILPRDVNLEWVGGQMFTKKNGISVLSDVVIVPCEVGVKAKFRMSLPPPDNKRNKKMFDPYTSQWRPDPSMSGCYVLGCDPFAMDKKDTTGKKLSNGGGCMFMPRDYSIDPDDTMITTWQSMRTCMTYNLRADTTDEFCEDMLKASVLYGSMVCTERNITHIIKKFRDWNCYGYLLHLTNPLTGVIDAVPGVSTQAGGTKERIFAIVRDYIKYHGARECHPEILEQVLETQVLDDMTDNDLFAALGMALLGSESKHMDMISSSGHNTISLDVPMYD